MIKVAVDPTSVNASGRNERDGGRGVSFVIAVYNKAPFIEATIRSVFDQDGDFEKEIIVVDDGSTDGSTEIAERLVGPLPNGKVLKLKNGGPSIAINTAIRAATKEFIKLLDGDDILTRDAAKRLLMCFKHPDVAYVRGASVMSTGPSSEFSDNRTPQPSFTVLESPLEAAIQHSFSGCTEVMFRRDAFLACGGCDETVFVHDQSYIWRLAVDNRFAFTDEVIAVRPTDPTTTMMSNRSQIEHDRNAALYGLVRDYPGLPAGIKALALRRCAGRAWKWTRRVNGALPGLDATFWIWLASYSPWLPDRARLMRACLAPYRRGGAVRLPGGGGRPAA